MATPLLNIQELVQAQSQPHVIVNEGFAKIEKAITGRFAKVATGAFSLSADDLANFLIDVSGTPGAGFTMTIPPTARQFVVRNGTTNICTISAGTGNTLAVPANRTRWVMFDGTNMINLGTLVTTA